MLSSSSDGRTLAALYLIGVSLNLPPAIRLARMSEAVEIARVIRRLHSTLTCHSGFVWIPSSSRMTTSHWLAVTLTGSQTAESMPAFARACSAVWMRSNDLTLSLKPSLVVSELTSSYSQAAFATLPLAAVSSLWPVSTLQTCFRPAIRSRPPCNLLARCPTESGAGLICT